MESSLTEIKQKMMLAEIKQKSGTILEYLKSYYKLDHLKSNSLVSGNKDLDFYFVGFMCSFLDNNFEKLSNEFVDFYNAFYNYIDQIIYDKCVKKQFIFLYYNLRYIVLKNIESKFFNLLMFLLKYA